ncbi:MAG: glycosyltransferase family 8 protein [Oscillospiraceae bacterium]
MNIVYSSDNNFADVMGVSIVSLFENNKEADEIFVYIIDNNISDKNKDNLSMTANKYNRKIFFIQIPDITEMVGVDLDVQRWSISAFSRLFLECLIPENIDKIIYLDCDTMIRHSLEDLYDFELGENFYCAAVSMGCGMHNKAVGLSTDDQWFNSGVMLISLKKWRENHLHQKFIDFIKQHNGKIPCVDEGVINGTINNKIMPLPVQYNSFIRFFIYKSSMQFQKQYRYLLRNNTFCSEEEFKIARNDPCVVHFIFFESMLRPWVKPYFMCNEHPYSPEWHNYKAISLWANEPLHKNNGLLKKQIIRTVKKIIIKIYNFTLDIIPKKIVSDINEKVLKRRGL